MLKYRSVVFAGLFRIERHPICYEYGQVANLLQTCRFCFGLVLRTCYKLLATQHGSLREANDSDHKRRCASDEDQLMFTVATAAGRRPLDDVTFHAADSNAIIVFFDDFSTVVSTAWFRLARVQPRLLRLR